MDIYVLGLLLIAAIAIIALLIRRTQSTPDDAATDAEQTEDDKPKARPGLRRRGMQRNRNQQNVAIDDLDADADIAFDAPASVMYDENGKKIGTKKARKLALKEEKRRQNEALKQQREEQKELRRIEEEERQEQRRLEQEEERQEREEEEARKAEAKAKEQEEYEALKSMFVVEDEGAQADEIQQESQGLLAEFVGYIKQKKVVLLEDLATHFNLKTQEAINRLQGLEQMGRITGVTDDRGKFIYLSEEELANVAKFIRQRGRVSIEELADNSNRLISLKEEEVALKDEVDNDAVDDTLIQDEQPTSAGVSLQT